MDRHRDLVLQSSSAAVEEFKRRLDERAEVSGQSCIWAAPGNVGLRASLHSLSSSLICPCPPLLVHVVLVQQLLVEESSELQMEAQLDEAQEEMQALSVPTSVVGGRRRAEVTEVDDITMQ